MPKTSLGSTSIDGTVVDAVQLNAALHALQASVNNIDATQLLESSVNSPALVRADQQTQIGWFSVKDTGYGAKGDGVTDDTAAINAAIAAAANTVLYPHGAQVWFPAGTFLITRSLTIPGNYVTFAGHGRKTSVLEFKPTVAGQSLFTGGARNGNTFRDLYLGCAGSFVTSSTAFSLTGATDFAISNCDISGFAGAFSLVDVCTFFATSVSISQCTSATLDCILLDGVAQSGTSFGTIIEGCTEIHFTDVILGANGAAATSAGMHFRAANGVWVTNCDAISFKYALLCDPSTTISGITKSVGHCFFTTCDFDVSITNCILINPGQQGSVCAMQFIGGRAASLASACVNIETTSSSALVQGLIFSSFGIQESTSSYGAAVQNSGIGTVQDVTFLGCLVAGNASGGILISAAVDGVLIFGCKFRPVATYYQTAQPYAVISNASASNVVVEANDLRGQSSAPLNVASTDGTLRIRRNIGDIYVAPPLALSSGVSATNTSGRDWDVFIGGGTVSHILVNGINTQLVAGTFPYLAGSTLNVTYSAAPTVATSARH